MTARVIALSGPPGAGKSTLGRWLASQIGAQRIDYDDYEQMTRRHPAEVADWLSRGAPIAEIPAPGLAAAIERARMQGVVVFETPLGRAWPETARLIDVSIWIDTPLDLALGRKLQIMARDWESRGGPVGPCAQWFAMHLQAYEAVTRPSLLMQIERVRSLADLMVDNGRVLQDTQEAMIGSLKAIEAIS
jgi:uridine kinase